MSEDDAAPDKQDTPPEAATGTPAEPAAEPNPNDGTVLDGDTGEGNPTERTYTDWAKEFAGDDEKVLGRLTRYSSHDDLAKALISAQNKISSGDYKQTAALPDNPTDEQIAAYRKDNGIPEKAEGYFDDLPDGLVIGDDDKPVMEEFAKAMHEANMPPAAVHAALGWYNKFQEDIDAAQDAVNAKARENTEDALRNQWEGADYRKNVNMVSTYIDGLDKEVSEKIGMARMADGTALLNNPEVMLWLNSLAREKFGDTTILPGVTGQDQASQVETRLAEIKEIMDKDRKRYNEDEKMQDEYRQLLEWRSRHQTAA
jgi:hypothetical protein